MRLCSMNLLDSCTPQAGAQTLHGGLLCSACSAPSQLDQAASRQKMRQSCGLGLCMALVALARALAFTQSGHCTRNPSWLRFYSFLKPRHNASEDAH